MPALQSAAPAAPVIAMEPWKVMLAAFAAGIVTTWLLLAGTTWVMFQLLHRA